MRCSEGEKKKTNKRMSALEETEKKVRQKGEKRRRQSKEKKMKMKIKRQNIGGQEKEINHTPLTSTDSER